MPPKKRARSAGSMSSPQAAPAFALSSQETSVLTRFDPTGKTEQAATKFRSMLALHSRALVFVASKKPKAMLLQSPVSLTTAGTAAGALFHTGKLQKSAASPKETQDEMAQLVQFKLARGQFRPGLLQQFQSNPAKEVHGRMLEALSLLEKEDAFESEGEEKPRTKSDGVEIVPTDDEEVESDPKDNSGGDRRSPSPTLKVEALMKSVNVLSSLKGIGPATATIFLASSKVAVPASVLPTGGQVVALAGLCPFMSDEALKSVNLPLVYTNKNLKEFFTKIRQVKADAFGEDAEGLNDSQIAEALWAWHWLKQSVNTK